MKGLFGGAEANLGHGGIGLEVRRLRNNIFRVEFIGTGDDALEVNVGVEELLSLTTFARRGGSRPCLDWPRPRQ